MSNYKHIEFIGEKTIKSDKEITILEASLSAGIPHYHACGGKGKCSTCRVLIHTGSENLSLPTEAEIKLKEKKRFSNKIRLACQTKVIKNEVKVSRIIKDDLDAELYVYKEGCQNNQSLGEEKKLVLFFLDIRNFTPFIEKNLPFDVIHILKRLTMLFRKIIKSNSGKIIESAGDGFYAVFGLDEELNRSIKDAIQSANKISHEIDDFNNNYLIEYFGFRLNVGIGIHMGKVIVGSNGFAGDQSLTVMGFPVNIASRLEQATKQLNNNIVISDDVYQLSGLKNSISSKIKIKGSRSIQVHMIGKEFAQYPN